MKKSTAGIAAVAAVLIGVIIAADSGAFSIREMLGLDKEEESGMAQAAETGGDGRDWGKPSGGAGSLDLGAIQQLVSQLDAGQRQALLGDAEAFARMVRQEADNRSVLAAAHANKLHEDAGTAFLMERAAENVLRESYLARLIHGKIPADFPSEAQAREYFDKNKDKFVIGERVHVWQIFFDVQPAQDEKAAAAARKQADAVLAELNQGKVDFAAAAAKHSAHDPSRNSGGYMGLVKASDLRPEISKPLLAAAEGKLVGPLRTESGIHILKRGAVVPAQAVSYDQVKDQIRQALLKQAQSQLRQAVYEQARKSYPMDVKEAKVEEWRLRLRTNLETTAAAAAKQ